MSTAPPPRYVVRPEEDPARKRRLWLWLIGAWLLSLVLVGGVTYLVASHHSPAHASHAKTEKLTAANAALKQKVATLSQSLDVSGVATKTLKQSLADSEEKINGLRADLAFYSHLIGGGAQHHGLRIQGVHVSRVGTSNAWNFTATLTHNVRRGVDVKGALTVSVEGVKDGKLTTLAWSDLAAKSAQAGVAFAFRYFQQVHGTLMLPAGFTPNKLSISARPTQGARVAHTMAWTDALAKIPETTDVQQQPAQDR